ncbi:putative TetR family transcriptional regulator [Gordonia effusa NBRC 100432]|uniref:Putative TetR family transcriptional regulator n=1 Tax=Gordonia effusa NBRC 100432 TaxID=1077974 RepID=H0QUN7_9ACTN|nr:TetR/AcrR family transcriptional regulator [Gordonia effusa]GAB16538.1 putative TetR family transcriptional regulator [Gordonia effusa NBRC 100432]
MAPSNTPEAGHPSAFFDDLLRRVPELMAWFDEADETTLRIVAAAKAQIEAVGWRRTTIDDIATRARMGRATIYRKFPTKSDILDGVLAGEVRNYYRARASLTYEGTIEQRIATTAVFTVQRIRDNAMLNRMIEAEPETILPALTRDAGPLFELVAELSIPRWRHEIDDGAPLSPERLQHYRTVAELHTRITLSFLLTRTTNIALDTQEQVEAFATAYLAPLLLRDDWKSS